MNFDAIVRYLEAGGEGNEDGIVLTEKQKQLLDRWCFVDQKKRERKYKSEQIVNFLIAREKEQGRKMSRDTAYRDLVNTERAFSSSYPLTKKYQVQLCIEALQLRIHQHILNNDTLAENLAWKNLQKFLEMYPDEQLLRSPKNINYIFIQENNTTNVTVNQITLDEALRDADDIANKLEGEDVK